MQSSVPCFNLIVLLLLPGNLAILISHTSSVTDLYMYDDHLHKVNIPAAIFFHGEEQNTIYVSDNGIVAFDLGLLKATFAYDEKWIAAFGTDIVKGPATQLRYEISDNSDILTPVNNYIEAVYSDTSFTATYVYLISWLNVQFTVDGATKGDNTLQAAIATDGVSQSYVVFLYETIVWLPDASFVLRVGVSSGNTADYYEVCAADVTGFTLVEGKQLCGTTPGVIVFRLDLASWNPGGTCTPLLPSDTQCTTVTTTSTTTVTSPSTTQTTTPRRNRCLGRKKRR